MISAMQRAIEVGVRAHAFSTRAFCAASSVSLCALSILLRMTAPSSVGSSSSSASSVAPTSASTPTSTAKL